MTKYKIDHYFDNHIETINKLKDQKDKIFIANTIHNCFKNGGKLYICGNGGSASDAQHIAAELVGKYLKERRSPCGLTIYRYIHTNSYFK